jgi:hypothetical protein
VHCVNDLQNPIRVAPRKRCNEYPPQGRPALRGYCRSRGVAVEGPQLGQLGPVLGARLDGPELRDVQPRGVEEPELRDVEEPDLPELRDVQARGVLGAELRPLRAPRAARRCARRCRKRESNYPAGRNAHPPIPRGPPGQPRRSWRALVVALPRVGIAARERVCDLETVARREAIRVRDGLARHEPVGRFLATLAGCAVAFAVRPRPANRRDDA